MGCPQSFPGDVGQNAWLAIVFHVNDFARAKVIKIDWSWSCMWRQLHNRFQMIIIDKRKYATLVAPITQTQRGTPVRFQPSHDNEAHRVQRVQFGIVKHFKITLQIHSNNGYAFELYRIGIGMFQLFKASWSTRHVFD